MSFTNSLRNRKNQDADHKTVLHSDKRINKTPQNSMDTENESPPHKSTSRLLKHLESSLSPKYIEFNESTGAQRSRYGREHKYKETDGFLPTEVVYAYQRVGKAVTKSEIKQNTNLIMIKPLGKHTTADDNYYESPIEKLISKNKKLILGSSAEFGTTPDLFEKTKKRLFTSLTDDSSDILLSPQKIFIQAPNAVLDIDKPKLIENMSPITNPVETSTPKDIEVITNPVRILQKVDNPRILLSLKKKLSASRKLTVSSVIHNENEGNQVNMKQENITHALVQELPPIKFVRKLEKVDRPNIVEKTNSIQTGSQPIDKLFVDAVKERYKSLSMITPTKRQESPFKNTKFKLSLKAHDKMTKKVETTDDIEIDRPVETPIENSPKTPIKTDQTNNQHISNGSDLIYFNSLKEGDVLWARLSSYPYWPCLVVPDDKKAIIQDSKKVHVKFFADNGRRCWVSLSSIIPYKGLDDFYARKATDEKIVYPRKNKQKTGKVVKPFNIPPFQLPKWEASVKEADEIFAHPIEDRLNRFEIILARNRDMKKQHALMRRQERKSMLQKRPRSPTPECPPFELIGFTPKKIKMESDTSTDLVTILNLASDIGKDVALSFLMNDTANLTSPGAETFYNSFDKRFLSNEENLLINKSHLEDFTKKLWNLKNNNLNNNIIKIEIKDEQLSENSITDDGSAGDITSLRSSISTGTTSSMPDTNMTEFSKNYLFRKLSREFVCRICFKTKNLLKCEGACNGWYHKKCLYGTESDTNLEPSMESRKLKRKQIGSDIETIVSPPPQEFLCNDCKNGLSPACFVCKHYDDENTERRLKCKNNACGRFFHKRCLKYFPQAKTVDDILICPAHSCHTCISDDPKGKYLSDKTSYVKCVICPASYHMDSTCIPAGTEFITAIQIICPKHREYSKQHNCNWCFICAAGGNLVCCETCPTAFHPECLNIPLDEKGYICEECETGRMPLYGEIVWAKFGRFRWWPAQIIPPPAVPEMLSRVSRKKADFCVKFFGSNNYAWINRGRVYLYQEGDWGKTKNNRSIEKQYENALIEAKTMYELLKQQKLMRKDENKDRLRPLPYTKIKVNKVVPPVRLIEDDLSEVNPCICDPKDEDPCGPYSGCLNRLLMFECHPKVCPARERCMNQMFEKRVYPNLKVKQTDLRGWGLVTLENLKAGTFIVEYVGEVIDNDEFMRRVKKMQETKDENYYFLTMIKDLMIDAGPKGNVARFMNHSCEPNCETQKWTVNGITRVGLFALVDIPANTELTFNYNLECIGNEKKACYCGASKCSGFIGEKPRDRRKQKKLKRESIQ